MRTHILALGIVALMLLPGASASVSFSGTINANTSASPAPVTAPASSPALQDYDQISISAGPGDVITASLTYTSTAGGSVPNDIDLTLLLPSAAPIPVILPPPDPVGFATAIATSRVTRATCLDAAAESDNKPALGEGTAESLSFTVPANGEAGTYALLVRGFTVMVDQPYSLTVSVSNASGDVTAARAVKVPTSTLITTNPHCELI